LTHFARTGGTVWEMAHDSQTTGTQPARELFQAVYDELRRLAAKELSRERSGHTLNPTALVHEAYLSLVGADGGKPWPNRRTFFVAAAEAMRHILVDHARYHRRQKRGGGRQRRVEMASVDLPASNQSDVVMISDALDALAKERPDAAELVKLRYFAGLTMDEAADLLELKPTTADRRWAFAKAWLFERLSDGSKD
jgi:RNA polymerase sigma factor (TIGR02999 family)